MKDASGLTKEETQRLANGLGLTLSDGDSEPVRALVESVRQAIVAKASALAQDGALATVFDARWDTHHG